jgi:hypothetical protein
MPGDYNAPAGIAQLLSLELSVHSFIQYLLSTSPVSGTGYIKGTPLQDSTENMVSELTVLSNLIAMQRHVSRHSHLVIMTAKGVMTWVLRKKTVIAMQGIKLEIEHL